MKNVIKAVAAIVVVAASIGNASAQYASLGQQLTPPQPSQTTKYYGATGNYLGSARSN